jgi:hypothetical protein
MADHERRVMRVALPVPLIREMDEVILKGVGGYSTRAEFIIDAIQERVLELTVAEIEDAGPPVAGNTPTSPKPTPNAPEPTAPPATSGQDEPTIDSTTLNPPVTGFTVSAGDDLSRPEGAALFGLHNRDFPSLWALARIAEVTSNGPVSIEKLYDELTQQAWVFGESLLELERLTGVKRTALFPTNREKRKSAELGFRTFAIGDYQRRTDATFTTRGPLFEWRVIGILDEGNPEPSVALTEPGWSLMKRTCGISIAEPHSRHAACGFLAHLKSHAPGDYDGFTAIVRSIGEAGATRQEVLERIAEAWPDWTDNEVSTNSAGYIARAREWGLVEPKQTKARYNLTPLGHDLTNGAIS